MKIRTDFVTNSSSSSFVLEISFALKNGEFISFEGNGGSDILGRVDYFAEDAVVTVSPKQLGTAKNVEELIQLLTDGVVDENWGEPINIFEKSKPVKSDVDNRKYNAYDFIKEIKAHIHSMEDIEMITISGNEHNYQDYLRTYSYNLLTKEYIGSVEGCEFEKDGGSGGDLRFDIGGCIVNGEKISDEEEPIPVKNVFILPPERPSYIGYDPDWNEEVYDRPAHVSYPIVKAIEGTGYAGRNARIEFVQQGDPLILEADYNSPYYVPVAIEVFNKKHETLGYLRNDIEGASLEQIAQSLDRLGARVASVTPLSKRSKRAKYALLDVEIYEKK